MAGRRMGSAAGVLAIGLALALSPVSIASASQSRQSNHGSQHNQRHGNSKSKAQTSSQTAAFCREYIAAVDVYQSNAGAFTHEDPALKQMVSDLKKAQSNAPAAIKKYVTQMLNMTKAELTAKNPNEINLSGPSGHISNWGDSHCPSGNSGNSGTSGSTGNSGASGNSGNTGSSAPSSTRGTGSLTAFCRDVKTVDGDVATLLATSKNGGTEVSASLLHKAAAAAKHLANEAPSKVKQDAEALARDLKSPNSQNSNMVGDEASLSTDYDTDCPGGAAYTGGSGNTGNSGSSGNSGTSSFGNSGNSGSLGNSGNS